MLCPLSYTDLLRPELPSPFAGAAPPSGSFPPISANLGDLLGRVPLEGWPRTSGGTRTPNPLIRNQMLYPLSYTGM